MNNAARACLALGMAALLAAVLVTTGGRQEAPATVASTAYADDRAVPDSGLPKPGHQNTVTVTPCRIVDTRSATAGALAANAVRSFYAAGSSNFPFQGGKSGGCGIPAAASSVLVSVSIVGPTGDGFLRAWEAGTPEPQATLVNFQTGDNTSVSAPVPVRGSGARHLSVKSSRATHVVIDVVGYLVPELHAVLNPGGSLKWGTERATASGRPSTGKYTVTFDRNLNGCTAQASPNVSSGTSAYTGAHAYISGNSVYVTSWRSAGDLLNLADQELNISVTC